jgi:hypothetical protein
MIAGCFHHPLEAVIFKLSRYLLMVPTTRSRKNSSASERKWDDVFFAKITRHLGGARTINAPPYATVRSRNINGLLAGVLRHATLSKTG